MYQVYQKDQDQITDATYISDVVFPHGVSSHVRQFSQRFPRFFLDVKHVSFRKFILGGA
jgi:hypothetical protein